MLIKKPEDIRSSEITPKSLYLNRRISRGSGDGRAAAASGNRTARSRSLLRTAFARQTSLTALRRVRSAPPRRSLRYKDVTHYNNYYEFSTEKDGPADLAKNFRTRPWKVKIEGAVEKKQELDVDEIIKMAPPEERIYRHRCVEGWSIVVPWIGFSLSELIKRVKPTSKASTSSSPRSSITAQMPGQQP